MVKIDKDTTGQTQNAKHAKKPSTKHEHADNNKVISDGTKKPAKVSTADNVPQKNTADISANKHAKKDTPKPKESINKESVPAKTAKIDSAIMSEDKIKNNRVRRNQKPEGFFKRHKKFFIILLIIIIIIGIASACLANYFLNMSFESEDAGNVHEYLDETKKVSEPFYMLLVGTDTREGGDGGYQYENGRSDTCVLCRIDANNNLATMVSIPRDTQIVYDGKVEKFNAAYNYGGIASTINEANKLCGVKVSHYVEISFNGLMDMIDAAGGIEITVPEDTVPNNPENNGGQTLPAGKQLLTGDQALAFARSRKFADGDFTRTADQRIILEALLKKSLQTPVSEMPALLETDMKYVRTDLTVKELLDLATIVKQNGKLNIFSAMVPSTTGSEDGVSYVYTDSEALSRMMKMVDIGEDPSMVEITSGAAVGSSRDNDQRLRKQAQYYEQHPNSPGRAPQ